jgi:hypothetical protein
MTSISPTIRWAGPSDAVSGSTYKIERTIDNVSWSVLAAGQAATSPYASHASSLGSNASYGATSVTLVSAATFSSSGYAWIDDALLSWAGKTGDTLTGVVWYSGIGTYASGTAIYEAHESFADTVTTGVYAVIYRITHILGGVSSAPLYLWYFAPPAPASSDHCVVIVLVGADLGTEMQATVSVQAYLASDAQFGEAAGQHLDANAMSSNIQTTNALGLALFHCWRDSARFDSAGGADAKYTFVLKPGSNSLTVTASTIPDRDWILLSQIV